MMHHPEIITYNHSAIRTDQIQAIEGYMPSLSINVYLKQRKEPLAIYFKSAEEMAESVKLITDSIEAIINAGT